MFDESLVFFSSFKFFIFFQLANTIIHIYYAVYYVDKKKVENTFHIKYAFQQKFTIVKIVKNRQQKRKEKKKKENLQTLTPI